MLTLLKVRSTIIGLIINSPFADLFYKFWTKLHTVWAIRIIIIVSVWITLKLENKLFFLLFLLWLNAALIFKLKVKKLCHLLGIYSWTLAILIFV